MISNIHSDHSDRRSASPEETRERILLAARDVMSRKGRRGATTREIADVAGVNEATLFRHFGNKDGLMAAIAQRFCAVFELQSLMDRLSGNLEDDMFEIGKTLMQSMNALRDMIAWSLVENDPETPFQVRIGDEVWRVPEAIHKVILDYMAGRIASGELHGDAPLLARLLMNIIFAHVMSRRKFPDAQIYDDADAALRFYIDVFLNGVRSK